MRGGMIPRERVIAAFRGMDTDCMPLIAPTSLANTECMQLSKSYFPYAHLDAPKMAALAATGSEALGFDSVMPYFSVYNEAAALGCAVDWGEAEYHPSITQSPLKRLEDFSPPAGYLDKKSLRTITSAIKLLRAKLKGETAIIGKTVGPLSLLFFLYGIQNTLTSLIIEPKLVREVVGEIAQLCTAFALAQVEAGADIITVSEDAAGDLISRECYRHIAMDAERSITSALTGSAFTIFHLNCIIMDKIDLFVNSGFDGYSFDSRNDLSKIRSIAGNAKLVGQVNVPKILLNGGEEDVISEVRDNIRVGIDLAAPECAIPYRVSNKNLLAMRAAVSRYGKTVKKRRE